MPTYHKVAQGECIATIAKRYKFVDYHSIYDHPKNAVLKQKRPNPNILCAGDILYIPDKSEQQTSAGTAQKHNYSLNGTGLRYRTILRDGRGKPLADTAYRLQMKGLTLTGKTDGSGLLEKEIPLEVEAAQLILPDLKMTWTIRFGHLDPMDALTGIQARLNSLGYPAGSVDGKENPGFKAALSAFQKENSLPVTGRVDTATRARLQAAHGC